MFATPQSYCVTPTASATSGNNFLRLQHRASLIIKDVKRRSMRTCKRKRIERALSGKYLGNIFQASILFPLILVERDRKSLIKQTPDIEI